MSRFTDDLYRQWLGRNGSYNHRRRPAGGMGGVPPMVTAAPAPAPGPSRGATAANDQSYSRHEKQDSGASDYVDNP
jgi:hypothetical protein